MAGARTNGDNGGEGCPDCSSLLLVEDRKRGETVCSSCHVVVDETHFDRSPPRAYTQEEWERKVHRSPTDSSRYDKGLGSEIPFNLKDFYGNDVGEHRKWTRMRGEHIKARKNGKTRDRRMVREMASSVIDRRGLPETVETDTVNLFQKSQEKDLVRGRSVESVLGACIYAACCDHDLPFTPKDAAEAVGKEPRNIMNSYSSMVRNIDEVDIHVKGPEAYVPRYTGELGLPMEVERKARDLLDSIDETDYSGNSPSGVAAGAIYLAARDEDIVITQEEVTEASGVSEVTIRKHSHAIAEDAGRPELLPTVTSRRKARNGET